MAETMEQYMTKTRTDYRSGVARPKIEDNDSFELKGQFLKELRENTFSGSDHEDTNEHIEKVLEIVDLFHERFRELLMKCPQHYLTEMQETSNALAAIQAQLNNLGREIKKVNEKVYVAQVRCEQCNGPHYTKDCPLKEEGKTLEEAYYTQSMEDTLRKFMGELAKRHEENSNLIKEIRALTDAAIQNQGALIKTLEIQIEQMSKRELYGQQFLEAYYEASHINNYIPLKEKDPGRASVSVMPLTTYLNLGLGKLAHTKLTVELADRTVKYPKGIAKNVLVRIGRFTFPVYFIILDMPKDIKVPLILGRPFLSIARAKIDVYERKITLRVGEGMIIFKSVKPASSLINRVYSLSLRERMELDLEARLIGETLVINRSLDPLIGDYIELNDLNEPLKLRRNQDDDLMPTIEEVLEDMSAYRDEKIGDVIVGEPFLREVGIKERWFEVMITIYNGNDEVTYQMVRSHPRFKHHTNEQCNKILPLLKVSEKDEMNGISRAYQKLKGFYKGFVNVGPDYIRDEKIEERLTRGHISVHEIQW
ncbi:putative reverse transcriptase domain-containing protein [Tanacetum coccineum]